MSSLVPYSPPAPVSRRTAEFDQECLSSRPKVNMEPQKGIAKLKGSCPCGRGLYYGIRFSYFRVYKAGSLSPV